MKRLDLRIVFMGTPEFAAESLCALWQGGFNIVGVVTMPDKPMGRHGSVLQPSEVKKFAVSKGIPVLQPERLKDEHFLEELRALKADLQVVVAFRMLPEVVWAMPPMGTINLHASLLPQYRGAAPINWAIINGETETGVTTFFLKHEIDTGKIIRMARVPITEDDNAGSLHEKLLYEGIEVLCDTLDQIIEGKVEGMEQDKLLKPGEELHPAPKIFKETCRIDWSLPLKRIYDFIRGLSPYPAAWTELEGKDGKRYTLKIYEADKLPEAHNHPAGTIIHDRKDCIKVAVADGYLLLRSIQLAGKKQMDAQAFTNGFKDIEDYRMV